MIKVFLVLLTLLPATLMAEDIFRIEVSSGGSRKAASRKELEDRVYHLERAVIQLQEKVFHMQSARASSASSESWICKIEAMGNTHVGSANSRAKAEAKAIKDCKKARGGDGFFCKEAECSQ